MDITIRSLAAFDLGGVARLFDQYRQFYGQTPDLPLAERFMNERFEREESVVLVADTPAHGLVGFCQMYPGFCSVEAAPICTLYDLFVVPEARRSGAGRGLLLAAEARAAADGQVRMDLTTARSNVKAQSLYESLGWVRDEVFFAYSRRVVSP